MSIITRIIIIVFGIFILNLILYSFSKDYRFFIKKIKNNNEVIYIEWKQINDKVNNSINKKIEKINFIPKIEKKNNEKEILKKEVILWKNYKDILYSFSKYRLVKLDLESNLFDLTNEYPDKYYEYYSPELTLYFFTTKNYEEVRDIMRVISYELPYKINEVNNFLDNSFYINLKDNINDKNIRIVISIKNITFWLKIKKNSYNEIKKILNEMKIKNKKSISNKIS